MNDKPAPQSALWLTAVEILLIVGVFAAFGAWPVPDVNETQYVLKARHFWQPELFPNDEFLNTPDTQLVFYAVQGAIASWLPLDAATWVGRLLGWFVLALGWQQLSRRMVPWPMISVLTAVGLAYGVENFHMAGEWVVGGVEGKVFAYGFAFLGIAAVLAGRWNIGLTLLGVATAWHVLVGGWSAITVGLAWLLAGSERPSLVRILPGLAISVLLAALGVIPNLMLTAGVDPETARQGAKIYVFYRLPHHLDIASFNAEFRWRFLAMTGLWFVSFLASLVLLRSRPEMQSRALRLHTIVTGSLVLVVIGTAIGWLVPYPDQPPLLRYYWFRLADVFVPMGVTLGLAQIVWAIGCGSSARRAVCVICLLLATLAAGWATYSAGLQKWEAAVPRSYKLGDGAKGFARFQEAVKWIDENLPHHARVLAPRAAQDFKWYTGRADVVNWKDIPQSAEGLVWWWNTLEDVHADSVTRRRVTRLSRLDPDRLADLGRRYKARYLLTRSEPQLPFRVLFRQDGDTAWTVYELPE